MCGGHVGCVWLQWSEGETETERDRDRDRERERLRDEKLERDSQTDRQTAKRDRQTGGGENLQQVFGEDGAERTSK